MKSELKDLAEAVSKSRFDRLTVGESIVDTPALDSLLARIEAMPDDDRREYARQHALSWRGLEADDLCRKCDGAGLHSYASTATWRGGYGGQAFTSDVCDACWGSGRASRKGADLRTLFAERAAAETAARELWAALEQASLTLSNLRPTMTLKSDGWDSLEVAHNTMARALTRHRAAYGKAGT